jgi:hypothetical protein
MHSAWHRAWCGASVYAPGEVTSCLWCDMEVTLGALSDPRPAGALYSQNHVQLKHAMLGELHAGTHVHEPFLERCGVAHSQTRSSPQSLCPT